MFVKKINFITLFLMLAISTIVESGKNKRRLRDGARQLDDNKQENCTCGHKHRRLRRQITDISITGCKGVEMNPVLTLANFTFNPKPVIAPGKMSFGFDAKVHKKLPENIQIDVNVYKYLFNLPLWIPCTTLSDGTALGSCPYRDVCEFLDSSCDTLRSNGVPCGGCEKITPGTYSILKPFNVNIPESKEIFDVIVQGEYMMRAEIVNLRTQQLIGCTEARWKISKIHKNSMMWDSPIFYRSKRRQRKRNVQV